MKTCEEEQGEYFQHADRGQPWQAGQGSRMTRPSSCADQGWDYTSLGAFITSCASRSFHSCACLNFGRAVLFPLDSATWDMPAGLAHIVFHSLCAKPGQAGNNSSCLKNGLKNFFLTNQGVWDRYVCLRTILSTKNVKKRTEPEQQQAGPHAAAIFIGKIFLRKINDLN